MQKLNATENTFLLHNQQLRCRQTDRQPAEMSVLPQGHSKGNNATGHSPHLCCLPSAGGKNQPKGFNIPKFSLGKATVRVEKHFSPEANVAQEHFIC